MATHFYTTDNNERMIAINNIGFTDEHIACWAFSAPAINGFAPLYRAYHSGTGDHLFTMSIAERDTVTRGGYAPEGIACYLYPASVPSMVPFYRAYRHETNEHFYTANPSEYSYVTGHGYAGEGVTGYVYPTAQPGMVPLYRTCGAKHFYTTDPAERQNLLNLGCRDEGIACYVSPTEFSLQAPLYRAYHPSTGAHFYMMDMNERDNATKNLGYSAEGIACYISRISGPNLGIYISTCPLSQNTA